MLFHVLQKRILSSEKDEKNLAEEMKRINFTGKVIESSRIVLLNLSTLEEKEVHLD